MILKRIAANPAVRGRVRIQAQTILPAIFQRIFEILWFMAPTPTMEPTMVCVVETGIPKYEAKKRVKVPPVSAQNPPTGSSLVIFIPIVFTMRHPLRLFLTRSQPGKKE